MFGHAHGVHHQSKFPRPQLARIRSPPHALVESPIPRRRFSPCIALLTTSHGPPPRPPTRLRPTRPPRPVPCPAPPTSIRCPCPTLIPHHTTPHRHHVGFSVPWLSVTLLMLPLDSSHYQGSSGILSLNPLLSGSTGVPPMYYNVTRDVQCIQFQSGSQNLLDAPAVHPPCPLLVLSISSLPLWSTIEVRNPGGVTARDVLVRIRDVLNRGVSPAEMGTMVSISAAFASASEYFRARTHADPREFAQGVKRIDFLGPNVLFAGLSRSRDGQDRWVVHLVPRA